MIYNALFDIEESHIKMQQSLVFHRRVQRSLLIVQLKLVHTKVQCNLQIVHKSTKSS